MSLLTNKDRIEVKRRLTGLPNPVKLVMFTQEFECEYCKVVREIAEDLASLSDRIVLEVKDFEKDAELAKSMGIDKVPALAVVGERDYGIRFYGVPAGYEFVTLLEDIVNVAARDPKLPPNVLAEVAKIDKPVHLQVMVTPTCPFCPRAVLTAHRLAMASPNIRADMVEVSEYPHIAVKYEVGGVPDTVINETRRVVGAQPELNVVKTILSAIAA